MARRTTYIIVEGPHDTAVIGKTLRVNGLNLQPVPLFKDVDPLLKQLVPRTFPPKQRVDEGEEALEEFKRVQVPEFYQNDAHAVAVQWAEGYDQVATVLDDDLKLLDELPSSIGIVVDADQENVIEVFADMCARVKAVRDSLGFAGEAGSIHAGPPRTGIFILPDNSSLGTLEDLLLECALVAYPQLVPIANDVETAVSSAFAADSNWLAKIEAKEFKKPAGPKKAKISVMGAVLKPSRAIGNTIRDHKWVSADTLKLPMLQKLSGFLTALVS